MCQAVAKHAEKSETRKPPKCSSHDFDHVGKLARPLVNDAKPHILFFGV